MKPVFKMIRKKSVVSTQDEIRELLKTYQGKAFPLIVAEQQTRGRGMAGNSWQSEKGANLTFSFACFPKFLQVHRQFLLSQAIALGVMNFISMMLTGQKVSIKWPNDIYVSDKKIAGILIENSIMDRQFVNAVVGVGINVNQCDFPSDLPNPVSLKMVTGTEHDIFKCLDAVCEFLQNSLHYLKKDPEKLEKEYISRLFRIHTPATYLFKGKQITASIIGVRQTGHLLLKTKKSIILECDVKEVVFL